MIRQGIIKQYILPQALSTVGNVWYGSGISKQSIAGTWRLQDGALKTCEDVRDYPRERAPPSVEGVESQRKHILVKRRRDGDWFF